MTGPVPAQYLSLATATKWSELQSLMAELAYAAPYWRTRSTAGNEHPADGWYADWDQQFRLSVYKYIEWCELVPRPDGRGLTLEDVHQVCVAIGFEVELETDRVRVVGYRRLR